MERRSIGMGVIIRWDVALPDATAAALSFVSTEYQRLTQGTGAPRCCTSSPPRPSAR